jgi:hypothetical protein
MTSVPPERPLHAALRLAIHDLLAGVASVQAVTKILRSRTEGVADGEVRRAMEHELGLVASSVGGMAALLRRLQPLVVHDRVASAERHDMTGLVKALRHDSRRVRTVLPDRPVFAEIYSAGVVALVHQVVDAALQGDGDVAVEVEEVVGGATITVRWSAPHRDPAHDVGLVVAAALADALGVDYRLDTGAADEARAVLRCAP